MSFLPRGNPPGRDRTSATGRAETGDWQKTGETISRIQSEMRTFSKGVTFQDASLSAGYRASKVLFSGASQVVALDTAGETVRVDLPSFNSSSVPLVEHLVFVANPDITSATVDRARFFALLYLYDQYKICVYEENALGDGAEDRKSVV